MLLLAEVGLDFPSDRLDQLRVIKITKKQPKTYLVPLRLLLSTG